MKYIEIEDSLINLEQVLIINKGEKEIVFVHERNSGFGHLTETWETKEECDKIYNRIKSILIGDNNE